MNHPASAEHSLFADITERNRAEVKADLVAELFPKVVRKTSAAVTAAADRGAGAASYRADRLVDRENDVTDAGRIAVVSQEIAAAGAAHAFDQAATAQFGKQLLKVG